MSRLLSAEEALKFLTTRRFELTPILELKGKKVVVVCWCVAGRALSGDGWTNVSHWLIQGKTPIEAITTTKQWWEAGKLKGILNQGILNPEEGHD